VPGALRNIAGVNETFRALRWYMRCDPQPSRERRDEGPGEPQTKPSTARSRGSHDRSITGTDVHWGLVFGLVAPSESYIMYIPVFGIAAQGRRRQVRAAKIVGLGVGKRS